MPLDRRTGQEYNGPTKPLEGHEDHFGTEAETRCVDCASYTMIDMVDAGLMVMVGHDENGEALYRLADGV